MRVLHVIGSIAPRFGGPSLACVGMAKAMAAKGHGVSIYTTNLDVRNGILDVPTRVPIDTGGVSVTYFPVHVPKSWAMSVPLAVALRRDIGSYDIAHIHSLYHFHSWFAPRECIRQSVPFLVRPHGTLDSYVQQKGWLRKSFVERLFQARNLRAASAIHYTTEEERRLAIPYSYGSPSIVVPIGIDLPGPESDSSPNEFRGLYPQLGDRHIILFLGRMHPKKGLDVLAEAFGRLLQNRDDIRLVVAGPDNDGYADTVRGFLDEVGALRATIFTGMLEGRQKWSAMRAAAVFVLPSRRENFGVAVLEAMSIGTPVVVSDCVDLCKDVLEAGAGSVVSCDSAQVASSIEYVLDHPEQGREMGIRGRHRVQERFDWCRVAGELENEYTRIMETHS